MGLNFNIASKLDAAGFKDASAYLRTLTQQTQDAKKANEDHGISIEGVTAAYEAFMGLAIVEFLRESIELSIELREQDRQLAQRVEQTGLSYEKAKPHLDAFFESLEAQTGVLREKMVPAFEILIDKTHSVRTSQELMLTTMGLAKMRGIDLGTAADMVGGAFANQNRAILQVGRALGLTQTQMKDHAEVLRILQERTEKFATNVDDSTLAIGEMKKAFSDLKKEVGDSASGFVEDNAKAMASILRTVQRAFGIISLTLKSYSDEATSTFRIVKDAFTHGFGGVEDEFKKADVRIQKEYDQGMKALLERTKEHNSKEEQETKKQGDNLVDDTAKIYEKLNETQLKLIAEGEAAMNGNAKQRLQAKLNLVDIETKGMLVKLKEQEDYANLSEQDQQRLRTAIQRQGLAARAKIWQEENKTKLDMFMQGSVQLGTALGKSLAGEQDAWRKSLTSIIDMVAQQVEAIIAANTARDVSFLPGGLANPLAWGIIGQGVAQSAGVAAVAAAADAVIGGGGGSSSGGSGGGGSSAVSVSGASSSAPAAAPAAQAPGQTLIINVNGQLYGDPLVIQRLADKISAAVQNNGVRLVATQLVAR